jgi:hypothetical protein
MPLAFHILAHRDPPQVARLLDAIWQPENHYVIHYDRRRPRHEHAAIQMLANERTNVAIQPPRAVLWGRYSLYAAQEDGLRIALATNCQWTHWINLSGQCYPLQSASRIQELLARNSGESFVRHFAPLEGGDWADPEWRLTSRVIDSPFLEWWLRLPGIGRRLRVLFGGAHSMPRIPWIQRPLPTSFKWYGGENWVVLSRAAAEYICTAPAARTIVRALQHSGFAEESIYQSVLVNSPLQDTIRNDHLRCINWQPGVGSPAIFNSNDRSRLQAAADAGALFARKFGSRVGASTPVTRQEPVAWTHLLGMEAQC